MKIAFIAESMPNGVLGIKRLDGRLLHDLVPGEDFEKDGMIFRLSSKGVFTVEAREPIEGMNYLARKECPHPRTVMGETPLESVCVECGATIPSQRARFG
jgi:hypothetical protein